MELLGEETEWSASTATLPLDQASPRSVEEEEEEEAWAEERRRDRRGLRALLLEMDAADKGSMTRRVPHAYDSGAEDEEDEDEGSGVAARAELRLAEERVRALEAQLLDAEETIHHLKAEKMEAWRRVEKLTRMTSSSDLDGGDDALVVRLRAQVYELEGQVADARTEHAVELEQQMGVIREQERELMELKARLADVEEHAEDVTAKYEQLLARHRQLEYEQKEEDEDDDPVKAIGAGDASPVAWREEIVRHPTPHFDLDSPEVQYLLSSWTQNEKKLQYLRTWLLHIALKHDRDLPMDFPMGIELPRLAPEIKDGFLTLVVPLLRKQPWREIQVHTKQYNDGFHTDLRIRVVSRRP